MYEPVEAEKHLIALSQTLGGRWDLVQAGGGNISVKTKGELHIKASGQIFSNVRSSKEIAVLKLEDLRRLLEDLSSMTSTTPQQRYTAYTRRLPECLAGGSDHARPSIETLMHALGKTVNIHVHSIAANGLTATENWRELLHPLFPGATFVDYFTPGVELAVEVLKASKGESLANSIFFLENHGLMVSAETPDAALHLLEEVTTKLEAFLKLNFSSVRLTSKICQSLHKITNRWYTIYHSSDEFLNSSQVLSMEKTDFYPAFPDDVVFWGKEIYEHKTWEEKHFSSALREIGFVPKVLKIDKGFYFVEKNLLKARQAEDVFKAFCMTKSRSPGPWQSLSDQEVSFLGNWEAEKFRKEV